MPKNKSSLSLFPANSALEQDNPNRLWLAQVLEVFFVFYFALSQANALHKKRIIVHCVRFFT